MAFVISEFLIFTRLTRLKGLISTLFNLYRVVGENFCGVIGFSGCVLVFINANKTTLIVSRGLRQSMIMFNVIERFILTHPFLARRGYFEGLYGGFGCYGRGGFHA